MNGVLVVDKPAGPTSHDVVARVRRAIRISRIGHTGTLDPLATGVLALVVGRATRLAQFLAGDEKEYVAGVRFGWATATYDAEERMVRGEDGTLRLLPAPHPAPPALTIEAVAACLPRFAGTYLQMPPPFSAKKIAGTPAYLLARLEKAVDLKPVPVTVRRIELLGFEAGLATIRVACSAGFYVRSLAHDLGRVLGCGAHLESLRRVRAGEFEEAQATALARIQEEGPEALRRLVPLGGLLSRLPGIVLTERGARRVAHGNAVWGEDLASASLEGGPEAEAVDGPVRLVDQHGALLAIGRRGGGGLLHPSVVLV